MNELVQNSKKIINALVGGWPVPPELHKGFFYRLINALIDYNFMRVKTIFCSSELSDYTSELQVYANADGELYISITSDPNDPYSYQWICFDKQTAIKFSKAVRREISFLKDIEEGINNG